MKSHFLPNIKGVILVSLSVTLVTWGQSSGPNAARTLETRETQTRATRVLILGTPHLSGISDCFSPDSVSPLVEKLRDFEPNAIAIEKIPSEVLEEMGNRAGFFNEIIDAFDKTRFKNGQQVQKLLSISRSEADARASRLIRNQKKLNRVERIKLIRLLIASYEFETAVLHWSSLGNVGKSEREMLPNNIVLDLDRTAGSANEIVSIGVRLAKLMGHRRLFNIDDHYDEALLNEFSSQLVAELKENDEYKAVANSPFYAESQKQLQAACKDGSKMLKYYEQLNSADFARKDADLQWGVWLRTNLESHLDRRRLALWDMRNLRIAANIRELSARYPGKNILVIIGAAHKLFLDELLSRSRDVESVSFGDLK